MKMSGILFAAIERRLVSLVVCIASEKKNIPEGNYFVETHFVRQWRPGSPEGAMGAGLAQQESGTLPATCRVSA